VLWPVFWYFLTMFVFIPDEPAGVPESDIPAVMASIKATNAISFGLFGAFTVSLVVFAQTFTDDLDSKRYRKLRSLPISPSADLAGRFTAGFALALLSFWSVIAVGSLHGASFAIRSALSIPIVIASLLLFCIIGMSVAVVLSTLIPKGEYLTAITNTVLLVLFFATGYNGVAPGDAPIRDVLNYVPNALATRLQVYHLTDFDPELGGVVPPELPAAPRYLALLGLSALVFWGIALLTMRRSIYAGEGGE
jgi:ABC-2 type transport system permease protein